MIALTDNSNLPLAKPADDVFYLDASGRLVLRSMTAFISLVQALANGVEQETGHDDRETLLLEESLLRNFGVYAAEAAAEPRPRT